MGTKDQIGIRIRTMRKSRSMTQEDLAKAIGQSPSSITMYETGRREPDLETLEALADVFNVPLFSLLSEERFRADAGTLVAGSFIVDYDSEESKLISFYRGADDRAREDAMNILAIHQVPRK